MTVDEELVTEQGSSTRNSLDENRSSSSESMTASSGGCNRRMSRTAREIVRRKLLEALRHADTKLVLDRKRRNRNTDKAYQDDDSFSYLLNEVFTRLNIDPRPKSCSLLPSRDIWQNDEEHSHIVPSRNLRLLAMIQHPSRMSGHHRTVGPRHYGSSYSVSPHWYQCGYCGKVFVTRFYLDQHLNNHHHHESLNPAPSDSIIEEQSNMLCPATDWCGTFLSPLACQDRALEWEGYYAPGSGGYGPDRYSVQQSLRRQVHGANSTLSSVCRAKDMKKVQQKCYGMLQTCFGPSRDPTDTNQQDDDVLRSILNTTFCASLSCPDRLHQLIRNSKEAGQHVWADLIVRPVHEWQDEWIYYYHEHHQLSIYGILLLLTVLAWTGWRWRNAMGYKSPNYKGLQGAGGRLLRRASSSSIRQPIPSALSFSRPLRNPKHAETGASADPDVKTAPSFPKRKSSLLRRRSSKAPENNQRLF